MTKEKSVFADYNSYSFLEKKETSFKLVIHVAPVKPK